jgi:hypothetical protein
MKTNFYDPSGLPQRRFMCITCPSRIVLKRPDQQIRTMAEIPHICHSNYNQACAGNLGCTEEGVRELMWQCVELPSSVRVKGRR